MHTVDNSITQTHRKSFIAIAFTALLGATLVGCSPKPEPELSAAEMYAIAKKDLDDKNWATAIESLRALEAKYPYGVYAEQAQLDTIYARYRQDETALTVAAADRFIKLHPQHESVDYAYFVKGLANYHENNSLFGRLTGRDDLSDRDASITREAYEAFKDVYTLFPSSQYAPEARGRAEYLYDSLARHELAVAAYYFSRNANVAVVNRAKGIVEKYDTTPSLEEALALLMFSYRDMGLTDLSKSSQRVLKLNFANSRYLGAKGRRDLERALGNRVDPQEKKQLGFFKTFLSRAGFLTGS